MSQIISKDEKYIAIASEELKKRIEAELQIPDPEKSVAIAILRGKNESN